MQPYYDQQGNLFIWTGAGYHMIPAIAQADAGQYRTPGLQTIDHSDPQYGSGASDMFGIINSEKYGLNMDPSNWMQIGNQAGNSNDPNAFSYQLKSGDKQGSMIDFVLDPATGQYRPQLRGETYWDTNTNKQAWKAAIPFAAMGAAMAAPALMGAGAGTGGGVTGGVAGGGAGGAGGGIAGMNAAGGWGLTGGMGSGIGGTTGAVAGGSGSTLASLAEGGLLGGSPGMSAAGAGSGLLPTGASGSLGGSFGGLTQIGGYGGATGGALGGLTGGGSSSIPSAGSWLSQAGEYLGKGSSLASALTGGGGNGSLLGGLVGAGLGYLDAKNQPDSITIKNEIDPRLADFAYGPNGVAGHAQNAFAQGQANDYLGTAGSQIREMGSQPLKPWSELVAENKGLWDANPFIQQQQKAITDMATRNLNENVMPGITSQANAMGGYGGSRQGIAQGLAMSRLNTDLAPALSTLASNAWENSQGRAMQGAQYQGNYGLQDRTSRAALIGAGSEMQARAPWYNVNQLGETMGRLPGNSSQTTPLFKNPIAGAIGGAQAGSQWAGNVDWGKIISSIGGLFK
jgi:hypothetical protein